MVLVLEHHSSKPLWWISKTKIFLAIHEDEKGMTERGKKQQKHEQTREKKKIGRKDMREFPKSKTYFQSNQETEKSKN